MSGDVLTLGLVVVSAVAFFAGVAIVISNVTVASLARAKVNRSLHSIDAHYGGNPDDPYLDGSTVLGGRVAKLGRATTPQRALAGIRKRLDYAGNPPYWSVDRVFEVKGLGLIVLGLLGVIVGLLAFGPAGAVLGGLTFAAIGYLLPDAWIYQKSESRQEAIRRTLPDIMDTLTVSVEAGLGFDAALTQVTRYGRGPLAGEFARLLQEMQLGRSRVDALRALGERTNVTELRAFCAIVVQATELGVPIASVLREQSREMRVRRRQRAEELAQKVPVKILFPLIFCLFPAIFIVVLGPGLLNILDLFR